MKGQQHGFQIPDLAAPSPLLSDLSGADIHARTLSIYGSAKLFSSIAGFGELETLWLSGVRPEVAVKVGALKRVSSVTIHDYRASDLTPFSTMLQLRTLMIVGSPKLKSLNGLQALAALETLVLIDNCSYSDLEPIRPLASLARLCLEGGFSKHLHVTTLEPLSSLRGLKALRLASIRVENHSLRPLRTLQGLREVFIADMFPDCEMRDLAAALPDAHGDFLDAYRAGGQRHPPPTDS